MTYFCIYFHINSRDLEVMIDPPVCLQHNEYFVSYCVVPHSLIVVLLFTVFCPLGPISHLCVSLLYNIVPQHLDLGLNFMWTPAVLLSQSTQHLPEENFLPKVSSPQQPVKFEYIL